MDLMRTAVVDITTLATTCRTLASSPTMGDLAFKPGLCKRLRQEIKRATLAYIDTLARARRGMVDADLLTACRVAAEHQMVHALRHQEALGRMLSGQPGALTGVVAARQDLWRLAHMALYARLGIAGLRDAGALEDAKAVQKSASRLRRSLRKAVVAYARAHLRVDSAGPRSIAKARAAAWSEIGSHGVADAQRLANIESGLGSAHTVLQGGVSKALSDLALDWRRDGGR